MKPIEPGLSPEKRPSSQEEIDKGVSSSGRALKPKDLEAIRRLLNAGAQQAATKLYSGAMDCGMSEAAGAIRRMARETA